MTESAALNGSSHTLSERPHHHSDDDDESNGVASDHAVVPSSVLDPTESLNEAEHLVDVCYHLHSYPTHSILRLDRLTAQFQSIDASLQRLVPNFIPRIDDTRAAILHNTAFIRAILTHRYAFQSDDTINYALLESRRATNLSVDEERMSRVRSTLKQAMRDWSKEGERERAQCYGPVLRELERLYPNVQARSSIRVLVPGSGLGRLVWEIANSGFYAQGNEFSYFMLLTSYLILNHCTAVNQWTIYPFIHETKNVMRAEDALRPVRIPDVDVCTLAETGRFSMVAGDFMDIYSEEGAMYREKEKLQKNLSKAKERDIQQRRQREWAASGGTGWDNTPTNNEQNNTTATQTTTTPLQANAPAFTPSASSSIPPAPTASADDEFDDADDDDDSEGDRAGEQWDCFCSCYFIDCSNNILETVRTISYLLKPGGYWINFGPLLYHYTDMPDELSIELFYEEIKQTFPQFGLRLLQEKTNRQSAYCVDERSMMRTYFYAIEWTCQKVGVDVTRVRSGKEISLMPLKKKTRRGRGRKHRGGKLPTQNTTNEIHNTEH